MNTSRRYTHPGPVAFNYTSVFNAGYSAAASGEGRDACPTTLTGAIRSAWQAGYTAEKEEG